MGFVDSSNRARNGGISWSAAAIQTEVSNVTMEDFDLDFTDLGGGFQNDKSKG